ncbi:MAG: hypothetical protein ABW206_13835 [Agrobacterium vaccinii]
MSTSIEIDWIIKGILHYSMAPIETLEQDFRLDWSRFHGPRQPLAYSLRQDKSVPWKRFHALPNSKRYAENEAETAIILERAYALGDAVFGNEAECWQVECRGFEACDDEPGENSWSFKVTKIRWRKGEHDKLLLAIADDAIGPTMWVCREHGAILAPYDGGFDLFPDSFKKVSDLAAKFQNWISPHPEGL